jgi:Flp pilus assembly secretin CpaC
MTGSGQPMRRGSPWRVILFAWAALIGLTPDALGAGEPTLEVGAGRTLFIRLAGPARSIVLGDPTVADVTVEAPNLLVVFGKRPGGTSLTVLGAGRSVLVQTSVVVQPAGPSGVTVTYGAGKGTDPGGRAIAYSCGTVCARASDDKKAASAPTKPATE